MRNNDSNYLRQIAQLGEMQSVTCTENILSADGTKLLPKGAQINRHVIKRLINHKLLKPIDLTTRIEDAIDHQTLITLGREMMARESEMGTLLRAMRSERFIEFSCLRCHLEPPIQNKLTVAHKLRPELLTHSLRVSLAVTIIGEQLDLSESELGILATAGLLHDLGELHLDIGNLPLEQSLSLDQWKQVRSHPIIGAMILEQFPVYKAHISRAVLEHHERLDGSGYPHELSNDRISRAGRLLAFAELAIGALQKYSLRQFTTIIKTNLDALDSQAVSVFLNAHKMFDKNLHSQPVEVDADNVTKLFKLISQLIIDANEITVGGRHKTNTKDPCLLDSAVFNLQQAMHRAGIDLSNAEATLQMIGHDRESFIELKELLRETNFQLRKVLLEIRRRSSKADPGRADQAAILQWTHDAEHNLDTAIELLS